ncbi:J domain-containing protein [Spirosoma daeguense]
MSQIVRIPTPGKDKVPLSKAQKEFNRLTKKIQELEDEVAQFRATADQIQQRIYAEYEPMLRDYNKLRADLVRLFDRAYGHPDVTKTERKKLVDLILNLSYDLISEHGLDELKPIYDKYDTDGYDASEDEAEQQVSEVMKEMVSSMYGVTFDENVDVSTKDKFMAYLEEQLQAKQAEFQQHQQDAEERKAKKPKSAKQQAREAKKQLEERNITKAVRTLYMDLVKAFHPDREPDESEKIRKTEIMKRVTEAYEKSDLLGLFRLQFEFNRIDQQHLETLAEDQLRYYNKILKQQADELGAELYGLQSQLSAALNKSLMFVSSPLSLEFSFNNDIRQLKQDIKATKKDIKELSNYAVLKAFLKSYKIQKAIDFDTFGGFFG